MFCAHACERKTSEKQNKQTPAVTAIHACICKGHTYGYHLADIWRSFGRHLGIIWKAYAIDVDDIWGSFVVIHFLQDEKKKGDGVAGCYSHPCIYIVGCCSLQINPTCKKTQCHTAVSAGVGDQLDDIWKSI